MRNIKYILNIIVCATIFSTSMVYGLEKQFIINYANAYGYDAEMIHTASSESDCDEDTFFDEDYGLCVPITYTPTDSEVGLDL